MKRYGLSIELAVSVAMVIGAIVSIAHGAAAHGAILVEDAQRHFRAALFEPAGRMFREALAFDAQLAAAHLGLAQTLMARRDVAHALNEAEIAVHLLPEEAAAHLVMASVREHAGDSAAAAAALDRYLAIEPNAGNRVARLQAESYKAVLGLAGREPLRVIESHASATIPFDIVEDKIVLKASVAGRIPTDFVLDTGAEHLVLSARTVEHAGFRRVGGGGAQRGPEMTLVDSIHIAGVVVRRVPALIRRDPLRVLPNRTGEAFSPIALGLSAIVDYQRRELTLARQLAFEPADVELPLHILGLPVVVGTTTFGPASFVIDTGTEATSVSASTLARSTVIAGARRIPMQLFDTWGALQPDVYLVTPGLDLAFGAIQLKQYPVIVRSLPYLRAVYGFETAGILGHDFLRHYRVTIDLLRRVVRFRRQRPERPAV